MPATDVALNEVWCCLKREGKSGKQTEADIIPLRWAYDDEDHTIVVVVPDTFDCISERELRKRLSDAIMDYVTHTTPTPSVGYGANERRPALASTPEQDYTPWEEMCDVAITGI